MVTRRTIFVGQPWARVKGNPRGPAGSTDSHAGRLAPADAVGGDIAPPLELCYRSSAASHGYERPAPFTTDGATAAGTRQPGRPRVWRRVGGVTPSPITAADSPREDPMATDTIQHLTDETFDPTLAEQPGPVVVDFWAEWCGPCRVLAPILDELAREYAGRVVVAKVNVDQYPGLAARYQVRSIPTLLFFKGGRVVDQVVGTRTKAELRRRLDALT